MILVSITIRAQTRRHHDQHHTVLAAILVVVLRAQPKAIHPGSG